MSNNSYAFQTILVFLGMSFQINQPRKKKARLSEMLQSKTDAAAFKPSNKTRKKGKHE